MILEIIIFSYFRKITVGGFVYQLIKKNLALSMDIIYDTVLFLNMEVFFISLNVG